MIYDLLKDFYIALADFPAGHPKYHTLHLLKETIRRDVDFLARHPTSLFQYMWNSCWSYDYPEAGKHFVAKGASIPSNGWERSRARSRLFHLLESWGRAKEESTPNFRWLRSLRLSSYSRESAERLVLRIDEPVTSVAFSFDGSRVAAGTGHAILVWEVDTGLELTRLHGYSGAPECLAFTKDGKKIGAGTWEYEMWVWDSITGSVLNRLCGSQRRNSANYITFIDAVTCMAFSPDGRKVACASHNIVYLWDLDTESEAKCLSADRGEVKGVIFSPDGQRVISVSQGSVRVWDVDTISQLYCIEIPPKFGPKIANSPDCKKIARISYNEARTIEVRDLETGNVIHHLEGHSPVGCLAFSNDSNRIVSGSYDKTLRIWDLDMGNELACLRGHKAEVKCVAFSHDGQWIVSGSRDGTVRVWDAGSVGGRSKIVGHVGEVQCLAFSAEGDCLISGSTDRTVRLWNVETGRELLCLNGHDGSVENVTFSGDGRRIGSAASDQTVRIWDCYKGAQQRCIRTDDKSATSVALDHGGRKMACGFRDGSVQLWNADTGVMLWSQNHHVPKTPRPIVLNEIAALAFSIDDRRIISASWDGMLGVWDIDAGTELGFLPGYPLYFKDLMIGDDGRVFELDESGNEVTCLRGYKGFVYAVALPIEGTYERRLWVNNNLSYRPAVDSGDLDWIRPEMRDFVQYVLDSGGYITSLAFSLDGRIIVSGSRDAVVRIWEKGLRQVSRELIGHTDSVYSVAFSQDGQRILSGAEDQSVRVWNPDTGECIEVIKVSEMGKTVPAGVSQLPLRAFNHGTEMVVRRANEREDIAWYSLPLDCITYHPSNRLWAGSYLNQLLLIELEGDAPESQSDVIRGTVNHRVVPKEILQAIPKYMEESDEKLTTSSEAFSPNLARDLSFLQALDGGFDTNRGSAKAAFMEYESRVSELENDRIDIDFLLEIDQHYELCEMLNVSFDDYQAINPMASPNSFKKESSGVWPLWTVNQKLPDDILNLFTEMYPGITAWVVTLYSVDSLLHDIQTVYLPPLSLDFCLLLRKVHKQLTIPIQ